ncbi:MAG: hypothetical protein QOJ31_2029 [Gaiellales bacterium]|jgi:hypothetical protein|nr:hypothetical protein [Gaiellales bacterium]MDX6544414.1 hypothetical protein [Gaiellales bacterium]MDX6551345.1 hypothetical protein [Gaiellales bacterium]
MFRHLKRPVGLVVVVVAVSASLGAYAFTTGNTIADAGTAGVGTATISGYAVTNVLEKQDATDPSTWSAVDFNLSADATQLQVKFTDSAAVLASSGWVDCTSSLSSTIQHVSPFAVHCVLPSVDSSLDTLTVAAAK